jgi:hypothetical protein
MNSSIVLIVISGLLALLAGIMGLIAFETEGIKRIWALVSSALKNKQLDAIIIGLAGAATFIFSAIRSVASNPANWHPQAFGIGFGAMASGLGVLFKFRSNGENH